MSCKIILSEVDSNCSLFKSLKSVNCHSSKETSYLPERLDLSVHDELELAEFAAPRVRTLDPLLQAGLVHISQGARAEAGRDERQFGIPLAVANAADVESTAPAQTRGHRRRLRRVAALHARARRGGTQGWLRLLEIKTMQMNCVFDVNITRGKGANIRKFGKKKVSYSLAPYQISVCSVMKFRNNT